MRQHMTSR